MKLFSAKQIRNWDAYTLQNEPIASIDLMERAASRCVDWLLGNLESRESFTVLCGTGNNGGDGMAIARMLYAHGREVAVYVAGDPEKGSEDFSSNLALWKQTDGKLQVIGEENVASFTHENDVLIDALFGSGLDRPIEGWRQLLVEKLDQPALFCVAVDSPSGIPADLPDDHDAAAFNCIPASVTLTFQSPKRTFFVQPFSSHTGKVEVLDIGLSEEYLETTGSHWQMMDQKLLKGVLAGRDRDGHKGTFGKALIAAGSEGMMGASLLSVRAALQSGCGLVQAHVPSHAVSMLQTSCPEALVQADGNEQYITAIPVDAKVTAIGIGPGLGKAQPSYTALSALIETDLPMVIDADGLNLLAIDSDWEKNLKRKAPTLLTPHPGEFDRLFGEHTDESERLITAARKAKELNVVLLLKGAHSKICTPEGQVYISPVATSALSVGGSGDVLTGLLTGLLAQGFNAEKAMLLGVGLHGWLGAHYEALYGTRGCTAQWLAENVREAWKAMR